tara:strand:+ start:43 stop:2055 length:2013 start_codon:yes stop_codon:yes gene_type:complete
MATSAQRKRQDKVNKLNQIQAALFPDGNIPPIEDIQSRIANGTHTVRDAMIARMYKNGLNIDPYLVGEKNTDETSRKFATALSKAFPNPTKVARNIDGTASIIGSVDRYGIALDSQFSDLETRSRASDFSATIRDNFVRPAINDTKAVVEGDVKRTKSGSKKLAKGAIPIEVLQNMLSGVSDITSVTLKDGTVIPAQTMRDAAVASLLGLRGTDLTGMVTTAEQAEELSPAVPYYDRDTGTIVSPDPELGGSGRKGKGPDRQVGPVLREILNRRYDNAIDGELFPNLDTNIVAKQLNTHLYSKIDAKTLAKLKTAPRGYTAGRKITASAIANQLGDPQAASEIISHGESGLDDKIDRVMTGFYTDVENVESIEARRLALLNFEKLMADATETVDAKGLGTYLGLDLPEDFNAQYPDLALKRTDVGALIDTTPASPAQVAASQAESAAKSQQRAQEARLAGQQAGEQADETVLRRATRAEDVAAAEEKLAGAGRDAKFDSDVKKGNSAIDFITNMAKSGGDTLKSTAFAATTAGLAFAKQAPGPLFDLVGGLLDKESYDVAEQKGRTFVSELTGQPEDSFLSRMGGGAGVVGEMVTGAVADPEGAARTNLQMLSLMGRTPILDLTGSIPDAAPAQTGTLEAEDAASNVQDVENRARRGQTTSMLDVQPQTL